MSVRITALVEPDASPSSHRLAWLASDADGVPIGSAFLRLFTRTGQYHLAELQLHVHPAEWRQGTGSRLLDAAVAAARDDGRRRIITHVQAGSPGDGFLSARNFRRVLTLTSGRLPMGGADMAALAEIVERPHPGYRLASWVGTVPDELAETFVRSRHAMNDMPMGGIDLSAVPWDLERVRAATAAIEKRGDILQTVAAIDETDGAVAAFTELAVPGEGNGDAQHCGTAVLPEHRGHGLGLWIKAASIQLARERYPKLAGLLTLSADNNPYMRRINDSLGYALTHTTYEYQLDF